MATVSFKHASLTYPGAQAPSVDDFDLEIAGGEFLVLVGPSGCGKSTTLRMLAGLEEVTSGSIFIGDKDVTSLDPRERDIAMVFQNYALYPHMSVRDNMGFALKLAGESKEEINRRVDEAAQTLGLVDLLDRKPKALSGGQRQRVAMGRAIVRNPQVFLMDEPLSNLDAKLRVQTRTQIAALQRRLGVTTVYVTHDQTEALTMGDRIAVLNGGVLEQVGTPRELYEAPQTTFVAGFIGSPAMNLGRFTVDAQGRASSGEAWIQLPDDAAQALADAGEKQVILGVRPEALQLVAQGEEEASRSAYIPFDLELVEELGADSYLYGQIPGGSELSSGATTEEAASPTGNELVMRAKPRTAPEKGSRVVATVDHNQLHCFSVTTGKRINSAATVK
ncbi:ABC transporter ATP-binding protein [Corynebacterium sp. 32222D000AT]|uniref:ABC transporter ATP-binding protein n=1 Tax=unclassified Corynebacterium TaxID=2624378 RepID=UPI002A9E0221|nr:sn-glycerol-3-phosphate ABC transporter ATP-binding protein UgpC [Mycobacteriaceae bacterium]MDY5829533.1 sn-glycerol-3-phosphate ABC transporter ATP-binding protein UgpC [Corynebacterium sp.]